jgi:hypothetical protein
MAVVIGKDAKLYRNTATWDSPTWNEIENCKDATLNLESGEADVTTRGSDWRQTEPSLKEGTTEFEMIWDTDDDDFTAIRTAWQNGSTIEMAVMDGDITVAGSEGLRADFKITNFTRSEPLEEALTASVTAKPARTTNTPTWLIVT